MYELQDKLRSLIEWTMNTYGISEKEAVISIKRKLEEI